MLNFTFYWPNLDSSALTKDICLIPFILRKYFKYNSKIITFEKNDFSDAKKYLDNLPIEIVSSDEEVNDYLINTDVLMLVGYYNFNISIIKKYKKLNPNGLVYLKTDFNPYWLSTINVDENLKNNLLLIDIFTVESYHLLNIINSTWPYKASYLTQGYYDFTGNNNIVKYEDKKNTILTVGRLGDYSKATEILIQAFISITDKIPDWKLQLVGPCEDWLINYTENLLATCPQARDRIEFVGPISDKYELKKLYENAKVFCLPSRFEGFPNVFPEAASNGCYIVSSNVHCFNDITNFGLFGSNFQIDNIENLSNVLVKVCNDENRLKSVCYGIQEYSNIHFNWIKQCKKLDSLIKSKLNANTTKKTDVKLVSILLLSYNRLQYIKQCLDSILNQSYPNIEIIISDDHSDNFSKTDLENYINQNNTGNISNYVIHYNEKNLKTVKNINNAIKLSHGDYLVYLSDDDLFYSENTISDIVKFHENNPEYGVAVGRIACFKDEDPNKFYWTSPNPLHTSFINGLAIDCFKSILRFRGSFFPAPGLSYKRSTIDTYGLYDESYVLLEDLPRFLQLTRNGCRIGFIDSILVRYRYVGNSTNPEGNSNTTNTILQDDMNLTLSKEMDPYMFLLND